MEAQNKGGTSAKPSTTPVSPNHDFFKKPPRSILNMEAQNSSGTSAEPSTTPVSHPSTTTVSPNHDFFKNFPPGFRFRPLDEELVVSYLMKKVKNEQLPLNRMVEVDLYNHSPDFLAETYKHFAEGGEEWYFFTPRERKYKNGSRPKRAAGNGYWKATGADKDVMYKGHVVGYKKSLVFYRGKPPSGDKTNWIMHEFRVNEPPREKSNPNDMRLNEWVLCRIYKKGETHHRIPDLKDLKEDQTDEGRHHEHEKEPNSTAVAVTNFHPSSLHLDHANLSSQRSHIGREHVYVHERFPSEMTLPPLKNMEEDGSKEGGYHQKEPDSTPAGAVTYHPNILDIEQVNLSLKRRNTERDYEFGNQPLPPEIMPLHQQIQHNNLVEEPSLCNLSSPQMLKPEDFTENLQGLLEFLSKLT